TQWQHRLSRFPDPAGARSRPGWALAGVEQARMAWCGLRRRPTTARQPLAMRDASSPPDANRHVRSANTDDAGRSLDVHRVGVQLGDPAGHERGDPAKDLHHEAELLLRRRVLKLGEGDLAIGTERDPRLVFQRDAETTVYAGAKRVILVDRIAGASGM